MTRRLLTLNPGCVLWSRRCQIYIVLRFRLYVINFKDKSANVIAGLYVCLHVFAYRVVDGGSGRG